mgnify:CR=1 FL=1
MEKSHQPSFIPVSQLDRECMEFWSVPIWNPNDKYFHQRIIPRGENLSSFPTEMRAFVARFEPGKALHFPKGEEYGGLYEVSTDIDSESSAYRVLEPVVHDPNIEKLLLETLSNYYDSMTEQGKYKKSLNLLYYYGLLVSHPKYCRDMIVSPVIRSFIKQYIDDVFQYEPLTFIMNYFEWYGAFLLYREETQAGRKSELNHRHFIPLDDIYELCNKPWLFSNRSVVECDERKVNRMNNPTDAQTIFSHFTYGIFDDFTWENCYAVGSIIDACCKYRRDNPMNVPFFYLPFSDLHLKRVDLLFPRFENGEYKSDLDILCDTDDFEETAMYVINHIKKRFPDIEVIKKPVGTNFYKYIVIIKEKLKIEVFQAKINNVVGFHVAPVRGYYNGSFVLTFSAICAFVTGLIPEYRWIMGGKSAYDILIKQLNRKWKIILNRMEVVLLMHYLHYNDITLQIPNFETTLLPPYRLQVEEPGRVSMEQYRSITSCKLERSSSPLFMYNAQRYPRRFAKFPCVSKVIIKGEIVPPCYSLYKIHIALMTEKQIIVTLSTHSIGTETQEDEDVGLEIVNTSF